MNTAAISYIYKLTAFLCIFSYSFGVNEAYNPDDDIWLHDDGTYEAEETDIQRKSVEGQEQQEASYYCDHFNYYTGDYEDNVEYNLMELPVYHDDANCDCLNTLYTYLSIIMSVCVVPMPFSSV